MRWLFTAGSRPALEYPSDGGIVDVTDYGAISDDGIDDPAAIQNAVYAK